MSPEARVYLAAFCVGLIFARVLMAAEALDQSEEESSEHPST